MEEVTWREQYRSRCLSSDTLEVKVAALKAEGKRIVTLNGCFDLLHVGHLHMFYEASKRGDVLIVALNSDTSIRGYKGPDRPITPLRERMQMVSALRFVDYVTFFEEATPIAILEKIKPDVHVNGVEYGKECIEAETVKRHGGRIELISFIEGKSTTNTIAKLRDQGVEHATSS